MQDGLVRHGIASVVTVSQTGVRKYSQSWYYGIRRVRFVLTTSPIVGFTQIPVSSSPTYNVNGQAAPDSPSIDSAQIKICMDPTDTAAALTMITSPNPPQYLELFNEPDFSYMGFTPLTSPQDAAANLTQILAAQTTTKFISPAVAFINSDWLAQFDTACGQCIESKIDIVSAHIYNTSPDTVISMLQTLHSTWNKPIWITELAPASDPSQGCTFNDAEVINWMQTLLPQIVNLGYVERVFWNTGGWVNQQTPWVSRAVC